MKFKNIIRRRILESNNIESDYSIGDKVYYESLQDKENKDGEYIIVNIEKVIDKSEYKGYTIIYTLQPLDTIKAMDFNLSDI